LSSFAQGVFNETDSQYFFVGQACRQKGLHYLLEVWRHFELPNAELRIVGRFPRYKGIVANYTQVARLLGPLEWIGLREEYRRADLLCLPSLSDGFGQVVLEALACGTPALTTSLCGASDLILDRQNGFVVPAGDIEALIASLEWASRNRDQVQQMRASARATAEQYPWTRFRQSIVERLRLLTAGG
jgi:glycosyltransferase involved in cell wall biosynthesis